MRKVRGFSLVENVVAILLLGVVLTATIFALAAARMWVKAAKHDYQAACLAREKLEFLLAGGDQPAAPEVVTIDPESGLTGTLTVSNPTLKTVDVTVSWTERIWQDISRSETIVLRLP